MQDEVQQTMDGFKTTVNRLKSERDGFEKKTTRVQEKLQKV